MNLPRTFRSAKSGFTLVELLVAMTVLVIIILLFGQMLGLMSKAWTFGKGRANNFTKARAMMELLAEDVQAGVFRPDLAAFPSGSTGTGTIPYTPSPTTPPIWEFYTARPGIPLASTPSSSLPAALRNLSIVQYTLNYTSSPPDATRTFALERADCPILWSDQATNPLFASPLSFPTATTQIPIQRDTAPGVVAFQIVFVQGDGSLNRTFVPISTGGVANAYPTRAVTVSLAIIDDLTMKQLTWQQLRDLNASLSAIPTSGTTPYNLNQPVKAYWDGYLNGGGMTWANYPKSLGASLATFERTIILPNAP